MSRATLEQAVRNIAREHPGWTSQQVARAFIETHGPELQRELERESEFLVHFVGLLLDETLDEPEEIATNAIARARHADAGESA